MDRSERLIKAGDSWFSSSYLGSASSMTPGGRALFRLGAIPAYQTMQTPNTREVMLGRHTAGANVRREEGNNPDRQLRPKFMAKW